MINEGKCVLGYCLKNIDKIDCYLNNNDETIITSNSNSEMIFFFNQLILNSAKDILSLLNKIKI